MRVLLSAVHLRLFFVFCLSTLSSSHLHHQPSAIDPLTSTIVHLFKRLHLSSFKNSTADAGRTWERSDAPAALWKSVASSSDGEKLVAAAGKDGIWLSGDSGRKWRRAEGGAPRDASFASVASSSDGKKVVAVAGRDSAWRSSDAGKSWRKARFERTGLEKGRTVALTSVSSSSDGERLAAAEAWGGGIWTSADAGESWVQERGVSSTANWRQLVSSADGSRLAALSLGEFSSSRTGWAAPVVPKIRDPQAYSFNSSSSSTESKEDSMGIWLFSSDGGGGGKGARNSSWKRAEVDGAWKKRKLTPGQKEKEKENSFSISTPGPWWSALAASSDGGRLAAALRSGPVFVSDDFGGTWKVANISRRGSAPSLGFGTMASSADGTKLVGASEFGGPIFLSRDGASTWSVAPGAPGAESWTGLAISADGARVGASGASGVWLSSDRGKQWTKASSAVLGGSGPANGTEKTEDKQKQQQEDDGPESHGNFAAIAFSANGSTIVASRPVSLVVSRDAGRTWSFPSSTGGGKGPWGPVAVSADGSKMLAGAMLGGLFRSNDSGDTWTRAAGGAPKFAQWWSVASSADGERLAAIANSGANGTLTVGSIGHLLVSEDAGQTWAERKLKSSLRASNSSSSSLVDDDLFFSVALSANGSMLVAAGFSYLCSSDFGKTPSGRSGAPYELEGGVIKGGGSGLWSSVAVSADGKKVAAVGNDGVFVSSDAGGLWKRASGRGGLPSSASFTAVAVSGDGKTLAALGAGTVWLSTDGGKNWKSQSG